MMKLLYFDCFSGISGDMCLAGLIDAGADEQYVRQQMDCLELESFQVHFERIMKKGVSALKLHTDAERVQTHSRHWSSIKKMIQDSPLDEQVKEISLKTFQIIAEAEGKIHGLEIDKVHFHEVGALDSILDIVGSAAAIVSLNPDKIISSPVKTGTGMVSIAHGNYPIPAMATLEILKGVPVENSSIEKELTTPTGAGLVKSLAEEFIKGIPDMTVEQTGYGAGSMDLKEQPNVLRIITGKI